MIFSRFKWNKDLILELSQASEAYIYYRKTRLNLITGFPEIYPIQKFLEQLQEVHLQTKFKKPVVYHFHYELGLLLHDLGHYVSDTEPLVVEIKYERSKKTSPKSPKLEQLSLKTLERPTWSEYKEAFNYVQEELLKGNCYQVNLTYPFDFETEETIDPRDIADYFFSRKGLGAYAHATYLGEEMYLSNSPECLFQYKENELFTMPIKGTAKRKGSLKKQWKELLENQKEEGELIMITDLLKNDLNHLEKANAKVIKLRAPLLVPGLLHQYSLISKKIENNVSLLSVVEALFPGGSITGAPKKSVMDIIQRVERFQRGIYCGSTLLCYQDKKVASINIRTAVINVADRLWRYAAGGGITLLSRPVDEFNEMDAKVSSFLTLLKKHKYSVKKQ